MNAREGAFRSAFAGAALAALSACGSDSSNTTVLTLVSLFPVDAGADASCVVGTTSTRVGCETTYEITGDPRACTGFDESDNGATATCETICKSGLTCSLSGLSNGTNVVACESTCGSPEH